MAFDYINMMADGAQTEINAIFFSNFSKYDCIININTFITLGT